MSSSVIVPVAKIDEIKEHTNSDNLEICVVLGWQVVVRKGIYSKGDQIIYCPPDVVVPPEVADKWGVRNYLKGKDKTRVGQVRLRGEPSFGFTTDIPEGVNWELGKNVADEFGITKYEPPVRPSSEDIEVDHALFTKYTDIENMRHFPDLIEEGEEVVATEKIHGSNSRCGNIEGTLMAGSHNTRKKEPQTDDSWKKALYWYPMTLPPVKSLLEELGVNHKQVILYGEIFGRSIQSFDYGYEKGKGLGYRAFDLKIDGEYVSYDEFATLCKKFGVETAPLLYRGPFKLGYIRVVSGGPSTMPNTDHIREGVVVKPVVERRDPKIGRVVLKYIGDEYLFSKKSDYTDN